MVSDNEDIKHAVKVFAEEEKGADCDRLLGIANNVFGSLDLRDKVVLDVGSGRGLLSFVAAAGGARRVVALEPEADGSTSGVVDAFAAVRQRLSLNNLSLYGTRLQEYNYAEAPFDIVVMYNSINHIDEDACIKYRTDPASKEIYINLFKKIYQNISMGGTIVVADCSSRNLFGDIGLRNPIVTNIEWDKHQSPETWFEGLEKAGFKKESLHWTPLHSLRFARPLAGTRLLSYCTNSHFVALAKK